MTRGLVLAPPPVARGATPPARIPPTQTMFARGPGAVGIRATDATNYYDFFYSWAVGIKPPRHAGACHPSAEGNLLRSRRGLSSPPLEGWHEVPGWLETAGLGTYSHLSSRGSETTVAIQ